MNSSFSRTGYKFVTGREKRAKPLKEGYIVHTYSLGLFYALNRGYGLIDDEEEK